MRLLIAVGAGRLFAGCATVPPTPEVPVVVTNPTPAGHAELTRAVREALHGAPLTLADDALTRENTLIVERVPARGPDGTPLQGREPGRPEHFRLVKAGARCVLVHEGTGRRYALSSVHCAPR